MKTSFIFLGIIFLAIACKTVSNDLSANGKNVEIIQGTPNLNCSKLATQEAISGEGVGAALNMLKNWAATKEASHLKIDNSSVDDAANTHLVGTAFKCPKIVPPSVKPETKAQKTNKTSTYKKKNKK